MNSVDIKTPLIAEMVDREVVPRQSLNPILSGLFVLCFMPKYPLFLYNFLAILHN